ncbi:MAG TPA: urea ABC transporter ATP-binding subunit UrtE [Polyangiaceae bacterium]|nr:urea ABC transporter ATP-binding subunit UrtE [Polyangiaceae bacterium]
MLAVSQLNQYYGGSHILWDVDLEVPKGSCTVIMGRNGVGKTTLLKTVMGILPLRSGSVKFAASELASRPPESRARAGIGYVPQGREIFSDLNVGENLLIGLGAGGSASRKDEILDRIFRLFPVLKKMLRRRGGDLSGGQQQQLAIGRALAIEPSLLILDEPTEGIQPNVVHEIGDTIMRLNKEDNLTVLVVEQKLPFAKRIADRFCIMDRGRSAAKGAMSELSEELIHKHLTV